MSDATNDNSTAAPRPGGAYTMSSITGKLVLAMVRGSDYAHAGEEEAIERVLGPLALAPDTRALDVGCGIGGTARFVESRGWGKVTGVDIDPANIAAADARHAGIRFVCSDVVELQRHLPADFDIVYAFNAFFLFADQPRALAAMRAVARPAARLALFDYVDLGGYAERRATTPGARNALRLDRMERMLADAAWRLDDIVPMHAEYLRWYEELVARIESKRDAIVAQSSEGFYEYVLNRYAETRDDARAGCLGGAVIYATAS